MVIALALTVVLIPSPAEKVSVSPNETASLVPDSAAIVIEELAKLELAIPAVPLKSAFTILLMVLLEEFMVLFVRVWATVSPAITFQLSPSH